jgi:hypothetical protein
MSVQHVEVLVEEPSMEPVMRALLPRLLGTTSFEVHPHLCKADLLAKLPARLRGYRRWLPVDWRIVVVLDRDDEDCHVLKRRLEHTAEAADMVTRTASRGRPYQVVNRLVVEELEAWYFGDWHAVRVAYPRASPGIPAKASYRDPDGIRGGTCEVFERILQKAGYFAGGLRKVEAARAIAPHMAPDTNTSASFKAFRDALREMAT